MGIIKMDDEHWAVAVAEDGTPVTTAMVNEWCEAYDKGELPNGYEVDRSIKSGELRGLHGTTPEGVKREVVKADSGGFSDLDFSKENAAAPLVEEKMGTVSMPVPGAPSKR